MKWTRSGEICCMNELVCYLNAPRGFLPILTKSIPPICVQRKSCGRNAPEGFLSILTDVSVRD